MNYIVLSRKWRPKEFDQVVGQEHVTKILTNALSINKVSHSYLFSGPRGVGKTTVARILALNLNNIETIEKSLDIIELDGASNRGIDEIRDLKDATKYVPIEGKYKIFIIDEAHMLTKEAFNALLKTLEEPPSHVVFILATTEIHKIPATISSRCQKYDFKRITLNDTMKHLEHIATKEGYKIDSKALRAIASKSDGSLRDALSLLDKVFSISDNEITHDLVKNVLGIIDQDIYLKIFEKTISREISELISCVNSALDSGASPSAFLEGFIQYVRDSICYLSMYRKELDLSIESEKFLNNNKEYVIELKQILDLSIEYINSHHNNLNAVSLENLFLKIVNSTHQDVKDLKDEKTFKKTVDSNNNFPDKERAENQVKADNKNFDLNEIWGQFLEKMESHDLRFYCVLEKIKIKEGGADKIILKTSGLSKYDLNFIDDNLQKIESSVKSITGRKIIFDIDRKKEENHDPEEVKKVDSVEQKKDEKEDEKKEFKEHPLIDSAISDYNGKIIK